MSFFEQHYNDRIYLKSNKINTSHCFTSKMGGVSCGKINGFNFGFRVSDNPDSVKENFRLLAKDMDYTLENIVLSKQTHTKNIRIVTESDCGKGVVKDSDIEDTDGLVTNIPNIPLVVFAADCIPVLLYDEKKRVAAAVHAGWRGSVAGIVPECISIMKSYFGCNPSDICAAIGPSIGPCCFEFGPEAIECFGDKYITPLPDKKYKVNLWNYNCDLLTVAGILPENIDISGICTVCHCDKFYSYRTHKEQTGRQIASIMIKG